jgi:hypothetical protein
MSSNESFSKDMSGVGPDLDHITNLTLGKPFFDERGKITSRRVVNIGDNVDLEISLTSSGSMNGFYPTDTATFLSTIRSDSTVFSKGCGILTAENAEFATYTFQGLGRYSPNGELWSNGVLFSDTKSTGRLAFLNNLVGLFKNKIDRMGRTVTKTWELK